MTVSPAVLPMLAWRALLIGSLWVPSPGAMNELVVIDGAAYLDESACAEVGGGPVGNDAGPCSGRVASLERRGEGVVERADRAVDGGGVGRHCWSSMT